MKSSKLSIGEKVMVYSALAVLLVITTDQIYTHNTPIEQWLIAASKLTWQQWVALTCNAALSWIMLIAWENRHKLRSMSK